ncbi:MAG: hypothetical protein NTU71_03135 [Verrucomicrobia bacterium]|nr:hypothetical protein [Verrucomicrobiota bacterium]
MQAALVFLLLLLGRASLQAELNTAGLPAQPAAAFNLSLENFARSEFGQALDQTVLKDPANHAATRQLKEKLSLDLLQDVREISGATYPGADGKVAEKNPLIVILLRGNFNLARFEECAAKNSLKAKESGHYHGWDLQAFAEAVFEQKGKPEDADKAFLVPVNAHTIALIHRDILDKALAALASGSPSCQLILPESIRQKFAATPKGWLFVYADASKLKQAEAANGATDAAITFGEIEHALQFNLLIDFLEEAKAKTTQKQIKGLQALAMMGMMTNLGKTEADAEKQRNLMDLIQKIKITVTGKNITLSLDYPTDKAVQTLLQNINPPAKADPAK